MIYSDILTKTEQVRDRLVSAINSKGGSLVSNASLNQCADAITALPEGGGGGSKTGRGGVVKGAGSGGRTGLCAERYPAEAVDPVYNDLGAEDKGALL